MATTTFQPFIDKENSQAAMPGKARSHGSQRKGLVGKSFQSSLPQKSSTTPRKALANVNGVGVLQRKALASLENKIKPTESKIPLAKKVKPASDLHLPAPAPKPQKPTNVRCQEKQQTEEREASCLGVQSVKVVIEDDIEHMPISPVIEDQFEDIWPKSARPSSYMEEIKSWRPYNLFPSWSNEEDTDDGLVIDDTDTVVSLFRHKIGDETLEEPDMVHWQEQGGFPVLAELSLPDIPLPELDDLCFQDSTDLFLDL